MTVSGGFTQTIDWLAFTLPKAEVADVIKLIGGDWFQSESGFRGYPVAQLMTQGKTGVGKLGTGAPRNPKEVHVDLSAGIVSQWDETKLKTVLAWIFTQKGHVTRIDVALDDREATVAVETVRQAVEAGQLVSRSKQFKVIQASNHRQGVRTGETLYFGSRESQSMLRVYDKRLELKSRGREDAESYGVRWEMEFKQDRAQACGKALLTLDAEDWRAFLVGVLRSYVDFRETTREAESYEKYRAPLVGWWEALTEVGDFVLKRADGCFTYQLAVVVDDAAQGITHVVRGVDLADNTSRQIWLQHALGLPTPQYLHTPLVRGTNGEKLSKQNGAQAVDASTPQAAMGALVLAAQVLNLPAAEQLGSITQALAAWVPAWRDHWGRVRD